MLEINFYSRESLCAKALFIQQHQLFQSSEPQLWTLVEKQTPNIFNFVLALVKLTSVAQTPFALYGAGITSQLCASSGWIQI